MTVYTLAPDVEAVANRLIPKHHRHLVDVDIRYVFRDKPAMIKGRAVMGKARLVTGLAALLGTLNDAATSSEDVDPFFVIEIAENVWQVLGGDQRRALVDHELCHCVITIRPDDDVARLGVRGHDLEEFQAVVERHGLWRADIEDFAKAVAVQQLPFDDHDDTES